MRTTNSANAASSNKPAQKPSLMSHLRNSPKNVTNARNNTSEPIIRPETEESELIIRGASEEESDSSKQSSKQKRHGLVEPTASLSRVPAPTQRRFSDSQRFIPKGEVNAENLQSVVHEAVEARMKVMTEKLESMFYGAQRQWQTRAQKVIEENNERLFQLEKKVEKMGSMRQVEGDSPKLSSQAGNKLAAQLQQVKERTSKDEEDFLGRFSRLEARVDDGLKAKDRQIALVSQEVDHSMQRHENVLSVVQQALEDIQRHKDHVEVRF